MAQTLNKVRIGGGEWRSRILRFPEIPGLRPTPDRVRETLFNWLGQELRGQVCLDLFSGSGALGFEALSRGATEVVMVEQAPAVFHALQENAKLLNADRARLQRSDALQFLAHNQHRFDIIFLDPPFAQGWLQKLLPQLASHLTKDGVVYAEAEIALKDDAYWQVIKQRKAGKVFYHLLKSRHGIESDLPGDI